MSPLKVLITGASGQLGSELRAICFDSERMVFNFLSRTELDLVNIDDIQNTIAEYQPNYIVHAAAFTAVDAAEQDPELADKINHLASLEIAKYCKANHTKLIYISTDYVFKGDQKEPLREDYPTEPINQYGVSKLKGEQAIQSVLANAIIIRTSWVYSVFGKNFVKTMLNLMRNGEEVSVVQDQFGSPTYAGDLAEVIKQILTMGYWEPGIYHYSNEGVVSWRDFAAAIRDLNKLNCEIKAISSSEFPTLAKRPAYSLLSKSKIRNTFDLQIPSWQDSLRKMLMRLNN